MKAFKIDVEKKQVYEIDLDYGVEAVYRQIGCTMITCPLQLSNRDVLYVDEEALHKSPDELLGAFAYRSYSEQAFMGNGLLVGADEFGEAVDVKTKLENLKRDIVFLTSLQMRAEYERLQNIEPILITWPDHS